MWFFYLLLTIVLVVLLVAFALANAAQTVPAVVLWEWGARLALGEVSLTHAMLAAFACGVFVGLAILIAREATRDRSLRQAERRRQELERELAAIRHLPFEEPLSRFAPPDSRDW